MDGLRRPEHSFRSGRRIRFAVSASALLPVSAPALLQERTCCLGQLQLRQEALFSSRLHNRVSKGDVIGDHTQGVYQSDEAAGFVLCAHRYYRHIVNDEGLELRRYADVVGWAECLSYVAKISSKS